MAEIYMTPAVHYVFLELHLSDYNWLNFPNVSDTLGQLNLSWADVWLTHLSTIGSPKILIITLLLCEVNYRGYSMDGVCIKRV